LFDEVDVDAALSWFDELSLEWALPEVSKSHGPRGLIVISCGVERY
jgi:hypothetical protein